MSFLNFKQNLIRENKNRMLFTTFGKKKSVTIRIPTGFANPIIIKRYQRKRSMKSMAKAYPFSLESET